MTKDSSIRVFFESTRLWNATSTLDSEKKQQRQASAEYHDSMLPVLLGMSINLPAPGTGWQGAALTETYMSDKSSGI